jgi:hypothetical protein
MFEDSSNLPNSMRNVSLLNDRINHLSTVRAFIWMPFGFANAPATFPIFVNAISPEPVLESMRVQIWKFSLGSRDLFVNKCGLLVPNAAVSGSPKVLPKLDLGPWTDRDGVFSDQLSP